MLKKFGIGVVRESCMLPYSVKLRPFKLTFKFPSKRKSAGENQRCGVVVELLERDQSCRVAVELLERDQSCKVALELLKYFMLCKVHHSFTVSSN